MSAGRSPGHGAAGLSAGPDDASVGGERGGGSRRAIAVRWIPRLYLGFATALAPWAAFLAVSLPQRSVSEHYRGTWVGFDVALIVVLARIGWFAYRRNPHMVLTAAAGATLLTTDAWFDVTTAAPGSAHTQALLSAVLLELPCAALCALLARRGLRVLAARAALAATASAAAASALGAQPDPGPATINAGSEPSPRAPADLPTSPPSTPATDSRRS